MNATTLPFPFLPDELIARLRTDVPPLAAPAALALLLVAAIVYVFYPVLLVARQSSLAPCRTEVLHRGTGAATPALSVVVPAYNEQDRLPRMLRAALADLATPAAQEALAALGCGGTGTGIEWIVVSDGSTDGTEAAARAAVAAWAAESRGATSASTWTWTLLALPANAGKGAAVRAGMRHARGRWRLMVDADGATAFGPGLAALGAAYTKAHGAGAARGPGSATGREVVLIGSRAHLQRSPTAAERRGLLRRGLARAFQLLSALLVGAAEIEDTQCGFKLFSAPAAAKLFAHLHLRGWAFDTELLYLAKRFRMDLREVPVPWHEVEGSKLHTSVLNLAVVAVTMLRDMVCVRLCYTLGFWSVTGRPVSRQKGSVVAARKRRKED